MAEQMQSGWVYCSWTPASGRPKPVFRDGPSYDAPVWPGDPTGKALLFFHRFADDARRNRWYYVTGRAGTGWLPGSELSLQPPFDPPALGPPVRPVPQELLDRQPQPHEIQPGGGGFYVAAGGAFASGEKATLRADPWSGAEAVGELPSGLHVQGVFVRKHVAMEGQVIWYYVETPGGSKGWIAAPDTSVTGPPVPEPQRPPPPPPPFVPGPDGTKIWRKFERPGASYGGARG